MSRTMMVIVAVLAVAFAAITGLAVQRGILGASQQSGAIGGRFHLVDQTGKAVDEKVLKGRWSAVFFGFTYCPEACPTTLFALGETEKLLNAKDFQTVFISVDPARDTRRQDRQLPVEHRLPAGGRRPHRHGRRGGRRPPGPTTSSTRRPARGRTTRSTTRPSPT